MVAVSGVIGLGLILLSALSSEQDTGVVPRADEIALDVRIERGEHISRIVVFLVNQGDIPFTFQNGSRGGPGRLDDGFRFANGSMGPPKRGTKLSVLGTAPVVIPELTFEYADGYVLLKPPAMGGPTRRAGRPWSITIDPGARIQYASFAVANHLVGGRFQVAELKLKDVALRSDVLTVAEPREGSTFRVRDSGK